MTAAAERPPGARPDTAALPRTLRLLASALGVSLEEAQTAADHQRAHRQMLRAAKTILGDSAGSGWPPEPSTKGASIPGANRDAAGDHQRAQIVIAFPDSGYPWLASSNDATLGASDTLVVAIPRSREAVGSNCGASAPTKCWVLPPSAE